MQLAPRSVRARITVAFTAGAAVVLALCLAVLYLTLDHQFSVAFDADLTARAGRGGIFTVAAPENLPGRWVRKGEVLGYVLSDEESISAGFVHRF